MGNSFRGIKGPVAANSQISDHSSTIHSHPMAKNAMKHLPKELVIAILEFLLVRDLLNVSETCQELKSLATADQVFHHRACLDYPLFETAFDQLSLEANKKDTYQYYKKIYTGRAFTRVQVHDPTQVNFKNFFAWYANGQLVGMRVPPDEYHHYSVSLEIDPLQPSETLGEIRAIPRNIRHMKSPFELFIPPAEITCWSDYFYIGEEIELQWGAGYFWWRGVVENIDGENLHLIFTQWEFTSHYYREKCIFRQENKQCKGVRKLEIDQKLFYRRSMTALRMALWPHEWDSTKIDLMAQKNLVS